MQAPAQTRGVTQTAGLTAASDGAYAAVHVNFLAAGTTPTFAMIRARDGVLTSVIVGENISDEAWASTGRYIGYTLRQRSVVRDAETGDVMMDLEGRFAGWSPDGLWTYIARADGLYAKRLAGGDAIRFSAIGVPVSATKP